MGAFRRRTSRCPSKQQQQLLDLSTRFLLECSLSSSSGESGVKSNPFLHLDDSLVQLSERILRLPSPDVLVHSIHLVACAATILLSVTVITLAYIIVIY